MALNYFLSKEMEEERRTAESEQSIQAKVSNQPD